VCAVSCRCTVIATGGSAVYRARAVEHLRELGRVVYLRLPLDEVERRLNNIGSRGIAMAPGQTLADLYAYRTPLYEGCADRTVDTAGQTLEESVSAVLRALAEDEKGPMPAL